MKKLSCICTLLLIVVLQCYTNYALEPITTTVAVLTAIAIPILITTKDYIKCQAYECCDYKSESSKWMRPNISGMQASLKKKLHGQHLVINTVVKAIKGHIENDDPPKALVLSFHGWTGGGKNYVSRIIADHLYQKGTKSDFYHLFVATLHFPHESRIETYKDQLKDWIKSSVTKCGRSLFVFDEMDKMPPGLIDTVKAYLDHHPEIDKVDYRKSIFIFLSNSGGNDITKATMSHWQEGKKREDIRHSDMEKILTGSSYNEKGGLWHSDLIQKNLISAFVPFLPMERKHIKMCIKDELILKRHPITEEMLSKVADELQYFPKELNVFSKSGCKKVAEKVNLIIEEL